MQAIWLENRSLSLRDVERPSPPPGESLLRVTLAGICATDLELTRGYYPYTGVLGHEFVAIVEDGPEDLVGRRVVGEINAVCRTCDACRAGRSSHCERRTVLGIVGRNGAFAEYCTLPSSNLHVVPDSVPDEVAVFTEPLAAALRIGEQVSIGADDRVLVLGHGRLGQLVARVLSERTRHLRVAGHDAGKRELLDALGIATSSPADLGDARFDVVVECTGHAAGFDLARRHVRPGGTLVMKSTYAGSLEIDASALVVDEIRLVGSRCGPFAPALDRLASGVVDPTPLIHARFPLADGLEAFAEAARPGVLKVLLEIRAR
ncbi:MAG: alcohol dehydrogenase catalytic domain-containing protein [bacterium]